MRKNGDSFVKTLVISRQVEYEAAVLRCARPWAGSVSAKGYSSVGRAAVSKTAGREFESLCPCHFPENLVILVQSKKYLESVTL